MTDDEQAVEEKCPACGHRPHRSENLPGGGCNEIIDNGWNWHGCHCAGGKED